MTGTLLDLFPDSLRAGEVLRARGWQVAVAESCTGGLLGAALTAVPGASEYMLGGVIAYANSIKTRLLDVSDDALARHGAVSEEVAVAMANGARARLGADVGLGITGVAGPGSEEGGKAAGLVYVAISTQRSGRAVRLVGDHGREGNRVAAVRTALGLIVELG